jgi:hypothetical protein
MLKGYAQLHTPLLTTVKMVYRFPTLHQIMMILISSGALFSLLRIVNLI